MHLLARLNVISQKNRDEINENSLGKVPSKINNELFFSEFIIKLFLYSYFSCCYLFFEVLPMTRT